jgi:hypothetical protein
MSKVYLRAAALLFTYLFLQIPVSHSAVITVNTDDDVISAIDLQCSLREAIISTNTDPFGVIIAPPGECAPGDGDDEIIFDPSIDGLPLSILIAGTDEDSAATGDFDITDNLTITGNGPGNTIVSGNFLDRVFHIIGSGTTVIMTGLSITQGFLGEASGAGIFNGGALTLDTVNINLNFVTGTTSTATGGGITNTGTLNITDTTIDRNEADRGAGIFTNNTLTISSSSVLNNTARAGGGITNFGDVTITNSTFSGNEATNNGGAIANSVAGPSIGVVDILNSTITQNTAPDTLGGGILNSGTLSVQNTILANNTGGDCGLLAPITSDGNNLDSDGTCALTELTDISNVDPMIGNLGFNGGSTPSHALMPGSPAIDAGGNLSCPPLDQRGVARPQDGLDDGLPVCDMGALEMLISELVAQVGNGAAGGGGCALAQSSQSGTYFPLYLLVPAFVLWRRLRRKDPVCSDT